MGAADAYSFHCSDTTVLAPHVLRGGAALNACSTLSELKGRKLQTSYANTARKSKMSSL